MLDALKAHGRLYLVEGTPIVSEPEVIEKVLMVKANTLKRHPLYNVVRCLWV
jgi:hypothetical protein